MTSDPDINTVPGSAPTLHLPRLGIVVGAVALILSALKFGSDFATMNGYAAGLFGYGFLFLVPFLGALILGALMRVYWAPRTPRTWLATAISLTLIAIVFIGLAASPMLLCLTIAAPLWAVGAVAGGFASRWMVKRSRPTQLLVLAVVSALTAGLLAYDSTAPYPVDRYTVSRSIEISASPDEIWPHLLKLDKLSLDEGLRTFSQNILGVPRPVEAIVDGEGVGAVRVGRWQRDVWFEEHVTTWSPLERLDWDFVFPDGSTFTAIDQHIDPRGPNVVVETGGYSLTRIDNDRTRMTLHTTYSASTAVNAYGALWGELIIGDVQANILAIVRTRAEQTETEPDRSSTLIAAN